jgi:hypothetical protein
MHPSPSSETSSFQSFRFFIFPSDVAADDEGAKATAPMAAVPTRKPCRLDVFDSVTCIFVSVLGALFDVASLSMRQI